MAGKVERNGAGNDAGNGFLWLCLYLCISRPFLFFIYLLKILLQGRVLSVVLEPLVFSPNQNLAGLRRVIQ